MEEEPEEEEGEGEGVEAAHSTRTAWEGVWPVKNMK